MPPGSRAQGTFAGVLRRRRVPTVTAAALLAASVLATSGCVDSGERVAVLGDSITALDAEALEGALGEDYRFTISGNFGYTAAEVTPVAQELSERSFGQVIINLGTNDVLQGGSPSAAVEEIQRQAAMFDDARCVHVVTVNEHMVDQSTGDDTGAAARLLNDALEELAAGDDRIDLVDWNAAASESVPDTEGATSTLTSDSVHPTAEGNRVLNELYQQALAECGPF